MKVILVSEMSATRASFATSLGATATFDPLADDVVASSLRWCDGLGVDVVFDCAGVQQSVDTAFSAVRVRGTIVNLAMWKSKPIVNVNLFLSKQMAWVGSSVYAQGDYQEVIDAIASGMFSYVYFTCSHAKVLF